MTVYSHADLVAEACKNRSVHPGRSSWTRARLWVDATGLRSVAYKLRQDGHSVPGNLGVDQFRQAARRGEIAMRDDGKAFATVELADAIRTEEALTDGERAERSAAAIRDLYDRNVAEYGDKVPLWSVSTDRAVIPQDGIDLAIAAGLIVRAPEKWRRAVVPADCYDAFACALERYEQTRDALSARLEVAHRTILDHAGPRGNGNAVSLALTLEQAERLAAKLGDPT